MQIVDQHKWNERQYPTFDMDGVFNAKNFGAKGVCVFWTFTFYTWPTVTGDGNSDDADAIQAAVDAATAVGGTVFLPKGFYRISRTINMTARALVGQRQRFSYTFIVALMTCFVDWSCSQSQRFDADVWGPHRHELITSSYTAFPPASAWFAARAAIHVDDVHCDVGALEHCVGFVVAESA
jgi:hypothetical protein